MKLRPRGLMTCLSCHSKFLTKLRLKFSIFKIQCFPLGQWLKPEAKDRQLSARNVSALLYLRCEVNHLGEILASRAAQW